MMLPLRFPRSKQTMGALAIVCGLFLVLPGCAIPKLQSALPAPTPPPDFAVPASFVGGDVCDNSAFVGTHEFFTDPNLTTLFDQALFGNQELRRLAQDIQIAQNEFRRRRGALFPFVTGRATASLEKLSTYTPPGADLSQIVTPAGGTFPNPLPNYLVAADLTWQIDIWRQLRNARDGAGLRYLGTIDGRNYVVTRLVAEIAENYYLLMALDKRLETLDRTIALQEQSLRIARARKEFARDTELAVQRFQAEVRRNQSEKWIIIQQIVEAENRINFRCGRYPQPVVRDSGTFIDLNLHDLNVGVPAQLLQNRPDIRQAERNLEAAGLDVKVARANFFPKLSITAGVGYEAFEPRYLFITPESLIYNVAGNLTAPLINKSAIRADYLNADATQLQRLYDYQRTVLIAFTEVVNQISKVQNYSRSIVLKKQQLESLERAVDVAGNLFQNARIEYIDVLFAQRDRNESRLILIDTKREQLSAIVDAYQALGGGWQVRSPRPAPLVFEVEEVPAPNAEPPVPNAEVPEAPAPNAEAPVLNEEVPPPQPAQPAR